MQKNWKIQEVDPDLVLALQQELELSPLICRFLVQRGISTAEEAQTFFKPTLKDLPDPFLMKGMQIAIDYLHEVIDNNEKILIFGDYDVDGTTSVSLLYTFLERRHSNLGFYLPDRYKEGYGLSQQGIDYAEREGYSLIITVDCGIKAVEEVAYAKKKGIEVLICDHHLPGETLPDAIAILDPKQEDCPYPYKHLSGCGIAFKLVQAFEQENNIPIEELTSLLDFVAISIASDIVPLTGENRILAHYGLKQLNFTHRPGLLALFEQSNLKRPISIRDIVFGLAPVINAAGRLASAREAVRLMLARNRPTARKYAEELEVCNLMRREYDQKAAQEAEELLQKNSFLDHKSIVLFQPHWHKGVIGIVASRIAEKYHKPTIILTQSEQDVVGSARSVSQFDIHEAIEACSDILINYGGHKFAAGMTMSVDHVDSFMQRIEDSVSKAIQPAQQQPEITISTEIKLSDISPRLWAELERFAPFGPGNRQPIFMCRGVQDAGYSKELNGKHLRLAIRQNNSRILHGMAFAKADLLSKVKSGKPFDICFTIQKNTSDRRHPFQLLVQDIRFAEESVPVL